MLDLEIKTDIYMRFKENLQKKNVRNLALGFLGQTRELMQLQSPNFTSAQALSDKRKPLTIFLYEIRKIGIVKRKIFG